MFKSGRCYSKKQWEKLKFCSHACFGPLISKINKGNKYTIGKNWKGDAVGYSGLHIRIKKLLPKTKACENCGKITEYLDLANISQKYLHEVSDWEWICRKCHMTKDGRMEKLKETQFVCKS